MCSIVHIGIRFGDNPGTIVDEEAANDILVVMGLGGTGRKCLHKALETAHVVDLLGAVTPRLGNHLIRIFAFGLTELLNDVEGPAPLFMAEDLFERETRANTTSVRVLNRVTNKQLPDWHEAVRHTE